MNRCYRLLGTALLVIVLPAAAFAAQIEGVRLFSEQDYSRLSISFDGPFTSSVETNPAGKLIFVKLDGAGIDRLQKQSFVYDDSPYLESVSFLPLGSGEVVARVHARQDFRLKTYETSEPYRLILEISPRNTEAAESGQQKESRYYQHGMDQMAAGSYKAALMSFRSAIRSGERVADSYYQAGRIRMRLGELNNARINFSRAAGSQRYGGEASLYLSWIHFQQNDLDRMAASWREFVRRVPDAAGRFRIATSNPDIDFRALEDAATALPVEKSGPVPSQSVTAAAIKGGPDAAWYFEQGVAAKQGGRMDAAAELLEKAVKLDPADSETHFQLGVVYKALGRTQASARQFQLSLGAGAAAARDGMGEEPRQSLSLTPLPAAGPDDQPAGAPLTEIPFSSAVETEQGAEENSEVQTETAGSVVTDDATPPPPAAAEQPDGVLGGIRQMTAEMVDRYGIGLLRHQVMILTVLMGIIFLLTLAAERLVRRKLRNRKSFAGPVLPMLTPAAAVPGGGSAPVRVNDRPAAVRNNKQQVAEVLAQELESKRRSSRPVIEENEEPLELQLRPVGERGMYGADIARRIKEELSPEGGIAAPAASSVLAGGRRDDMQTRLIRQLRSKNWTLSDIAQEMNLSREEIKWALAGSTSGGDEAAARVEPGAGADAYGQARKLAARDPKRAERISPARIDREVDLELEINV
ncbi:MAG: tetratricopeptide repeat protein [Candidatus Glassbacteria bacterium]|nr:tetratricopeptide repeat protein [Candidatus Glassbacteria bacterium]